MREEDISAVLAIAAAVPTAPHWPPFEFSRMLQVIRENPQRRGAWVACLLPDKATVHGFAMASHVVGTAELEAVVTAPNQRRKGLGSALLEAVTDWSRLAGAVQLLLEARASNKEALHLYARLGFRQDGLRRGYYRNPEEDAVLLSLLLDDLPRAKAVFK
jgi:ribosomal-protein-alanine N-acetyltransferase